MKTLVQINTVCNGSTGKIMGELQRVANKNGYNTYSFYGRRKPFKELKTIKIESIIFVIFHVLLTFVFNIHGRGSYIPTKLLVKKLKKINPDIIQIHSLLGYYINYKVLFSYLKNEYKGKVYWTLHDSSPYTGHCAFHTEANCYKFKTECNKCPLIHEYPYSWFFDNSKSEFYRKKELFTNIKNLKLITPSEFLKKEVKESFLKDYDVTVINNGIDLNTFKPVINKDIYSKYGIPKNKKIILAIANYWIPIKGLNTLIKLANDIKKNSVIVIVGLNKKQIKKMPKNIIGIKKTDNQKELVALYSAADLFVNPTKDDVYPTVNIEAIACGIPVITNNVGGCPEQIIGEVGFVTNSYDDMLNKINYCLDKFYKTKYFNNKKYLKNISSVQKYEEYLKLYEEIK